MYKLDCTRMHVWEVNFDLLVQRDEDIEEYISVITIATAPIIGESNAWAVKFALKGSCDSWLEFVGIDIATKRLKRGDGFYMEWDESYPLEIACFKTLWSVWEMIQEYRIPEKVHLLPRWLPDLMVQWKEVLIHKYGVQMIFETLELIYTRKMEVENPALDQFVKEIVERTNREMKSDLNSKDAE